MKMFVIFLLSIAIALPTYTPAITKAINEKVPAVESYILKLRSAAVSTTHNTNLGEPIQTTERSLVYLLNDERGDFILKAYKSPDALKVQREYEILKMLGRDRGEVVSIKGTYYLPQKYIKGDSLDKVIKQNPAKRDQLIARAAKALRVLHGKGIIHNDSHTANFIVSPGGQLHLIDFGESMLTKDLSKQEIQEGKELDFVQMKFYAGLGGGF